MAFMPVFGNFKFSPSAISQVQGDGVRSERTKLPTAWLANFRLIATASSLSNCWS